jgi:hypothetical protein
MTEQRPDPDAGDDDPRSSEPTETETVADSKDPVDEPTPLQDLGAPDGDGETPDGSPRTSPTD